MQNLSSFPIPVRESVPTMAAFPEIRSIMGRSCSEEARWKRISSTPYLIASILPTRLACRSPSNWVAMYVSIMARTGVV